MAVYAVLTEENGAGVLHAARAAHGQLSARRRWKLGFVGSGDGSAASELAALVGGEQLVIFGAAELWRAFGARPSPAVRALQARALDLQQLALLAWPAAPSYELADLCQHAGVKLSESDCGPLERLVRLHEALAQRLAHLDASLLQDLRGRLAMAQWPGASMLQQAVGRRQAERAGALVYVPLFPRRERRRSRPEKRTSRALQPEALAGELAPGGAVNRAHPAYEHRLGQIAMVKAVSSAFNQDELVAVEAGPGTGKSLAYLLPAIRWAVQSGEPVVVSTNTKSLQDQLATKDVPLLQEALTETFAYAVVKGRSNYACLRKVMARAADVEGSLFLEDHLPVAYLLRWLTESPTGELSTVAPGALSALEGLGDLLSEVRSETESCVGPECPWRPSCAVERMRRRAENADIIIANHALVFADAAVQTLPEYKRLVLDEAHNVEDAATDQFGLEVSTQGLSRLLRLLRGAPGEPARGRPEGPRAQRRRARSGLLGTIARRLEAVRGANTEHLQDLAESCHAVAEELQEGLSELSEALMALAPQAGRREAGARWTLRLTDRVRQSGGWQAVGNRAARVLSAGQGVCGHLEKVAEGIGELPEGCVTDQSGLQGDAKAHALQWGEALGALEAIVEHDSAEDVTWLEAGEVRGRPFWAMRRAPIYIGEQLNEVMYKAKSTVVLTSGTLTVDRQFHYLRQRLGLEAQEQRLAELIVESPFDYQRQLLLCIPTDMPLPEERSYLEALCSAIADIAECAGGGTLVLFTAYSTMMVAHERLVPRMRELKLDLLCQEVSGERTALLEELRRDRGTVLLGVKSFWEGVDVPGEALRCLVMTKLPFAVPSDPIIEARCEHLERQEIDSRGAYYVPHAILGFRQGLGRLVRTRNDRGVAFVLDRRVLVRAYGRRFLSSLEGCTLLRRPLQQCLEPAGEWLGRR